MININLFFYGRIIRLIRILPITFIVLPALISIADAGTLKHSVLNNSVSANLNQTVELKSNVIVEEAKGYKSDLSIVEGVQIDRGYLSPYFITDQDKMCVLMENAYVFLCNKKLETMKYHSCKLSEVGMKIQYYYGNKIYLDETCELAEELFKSKDKILRFT